MDRYQKFIHEKAKRKREFMGSTFFPRKPVLLLDLSQCEKNTEYRELIDGFSTVDVAIMVILKKEDAVLSFPKAKNVRYIDIEQKESAYCAADFAVLADGNGNIGHLWKKGCVPISRLDGDSTVNYNPLQENGNGFYFKNPTKWEIFAAVIRAIETYQFPYDWENLIREILKIRRA